MSEAIVKYTLPSIAELYQETEERGKENALNVLLNQPPKAEWIKDHPFIKKVKYLPVERVEWLLTRIFIDWRLEIKDVKLIGNSVVVTVRLHYLSVTSGEWKYQDGVGASPLQTDEGAGAIDFNHIKSAAVMMAAPAAESYAFKDAAEKIGKLFGKDLNRKDIIIYDTLLANLPVGGKKIEEMQKKIIEGLANYKGDDREEIKKMCLDKIKANEFTEEFATQIAQTIGVEL
jgi:hypothetical protein